MVQGQSTQSFCAIGAIDSRISCWFLDTDGDIFRSLLPGITCSEMMAHTAFSQSNNDKRELADELLTEKLSNGPRVNGDAANYGGIGGIKGNRLRSYISHPMNDRSASTTARRYQILEALKLTNGFTGGAMEPPKAKEI